jgi:hypothetical protein
MNKIVVVIVSIVVTLAVLCGIAVVGGGVIMNDVKSSYEENYADEVSAADTALGTLKNMLTKGFDNIIYGLMHTE